MPDLFDPFRLRGVTLRNRVGISPMCMYASEDGFASDWHLVHLGSRAVGGAGLVVVEASGVEARGRITPGCLGIWQDAHVEMLARITAFLRRHGAASAMQIAHAGRKGSATVPWQGDRSLKPEEGAWQTVAPVAMPFDGSGGTLTHAPKAMDEDDIATVIDAFAAAARRSVEAGFDMVEIHGAHGYLIHEFLSPLVNTRSDDWGGDFAHRIRFAVEIVRACRRVMPDAMPLLVRLSCVDWAPGGWALEDTVALAERLKQEGVDLIDCSSGYAVPGETIPYGKGYQVPFAQRVRTQAGIATAAVGEIRDAAHADAIIKRGEADVALIATASLHDAYWPLHAARTLGRLDALAMPSSYDYVVRGGRAD
jgi:2,4-dienoyl-CoA reductase-like NADH-dependent reductase (Old Yellow Enzyme family)